MNSYAFRFKLKNTKSRIKTEGIIKSIQNTQANLFNDENPINTLESNRENINHRNESRYESSQFKKKAEDTRNENTQETIENEFIDRALSNNPKKKKSVPFEGF